MAARIPEPDIAATRTSTVVLISTIHADLGRARVALREAEAADDPARRYQLAHLGALRTAAVLLAARSRRARGHRPVDVWALLGRVAPEYGEWASFFSACHPRWQLIGTGARGGVVSAREADDHVRDAWRFHDLVVARFVPVPVTPSRPGAPAQPQRDPAVPAAQPQRDPAPSRPGPASQPRRDPAVPAAQSQRDPAAPSRPDLVPGPAVRMLRPEPVGAGEGR